MNYWSEDQKILSNEMLDLMFETLMFNYGGGNF